MYFLTVVEVGKSKMTTALAPPDGDPLSHFQTAAFCGWVLTWPFLKACGRTHTHTDLPLLIMPPVPLGLRLHSYHLI